MAKTIIQSIGPLYGEPVNGTVFGRPNGSIYVPATNTITLSFSGTLYENDAGYVLGSQNARMVAEAQDLSSTVKIEIYADEELTDLVASRYYAQGNFNFMSLNFGQLAEGKTIESETTYYMVAFLDNNADHVATSNVVQAVGQ